MISYIFIRVSIYAEEIEHIFFTIPKLLFQEKKNILWNSNFGIIGEKNERYSTSLFAYAIYEPK